MCMQYVSLKNGILEHLLYILHELSIIDIIKGTKCVTHKPNEKNVCVWFR